MLTRTELRRLGLGLRPVLVCTGLGMLNDNWKIDYRKIIESFLVIILICSESIIDFQYERHWPQQWSGLHGSLTMTAIYRHGFSTRECVGCHAHYSWPSAGCRYQHQCSLIRATPPTLIPEMTRYMLNGTLSSTHALTPHAAHLSCGRVMVLLCVRLTHIIIKTRCCLNVRASQISLAGA